MRGARQNDELAVLIREFLIEVEKIFLRGDAVKFPAHDHHGRVHLQRIYNRQVGRHVQVGSGRHAVAERQFDVG